MAVTTEKVVTEDGARMLPPRFLRQGRAARKILLSLLAIFVAILGYAAYRFGPELLLASRNGFFDKTEKHAYEGTSIDNLKALHTALMLYHESEGQFPNSAGWMDAIQNRLITNDLKEGEAAKKLHNPSHAAGEFGYAMNDACSEKYQKDLANPKSLILLFESKDGSKNAHGDPAKGLESASAYWISVDGTIGKGSGSH